MPVVEDIDKVVRLRDLHNWLDHFDIHFCNRQNQGIVQSGSQKKVVKTIDTEKFFPVHTERPDLFEKLSKKTQIMEIDKPYGI